MSKHMDTTREAGLTGEGRRGGGRVHVKNAERNSAYISTHTHTQTHRQTHTDRQTHRQTHTHRHTDRQTQTDRHTDRHTDRQTDRHTRACKQAHKTVPDYHDQCFILWVLCVPHLPLMQNHCRLICLAIVSNDSPCSIKTAMQAVLSLLMQQVCSTVFQQAEQAGKATCRHAPDLLMMGCMW